MAGHGYTKIDPAVERWNYMREDAYRHFRFTPRNTWLSLCAMVIMPGAVFYLASRTDMKWRFGGKRKGESLAINPTNAEES